MEFTRRETLLATGSATGLAGCIDNLPGSTDDEPNTDDDDDDTGGTDDGVETDVFDLGPSQAEPLWATVDGATGFVTRLEAENDLWMVEDPEAIEGLQSWLDETDFEGATVLYVETAGPNTCYSTLEVTDVTIDGDEIVGTAEAVDTSDDDEACGQAERHPSAFVRVTGPDVPDDATVTVVDGWGETSEVTTDGRYADPDGLPGHVRPDGDPGKLAEFSCEDADFRRLESPAGDTVALGEAHDDEQVSFAMRVHATQALAAGDEGSPRVGRGHEVRVTMHNVSTDVMHTGNRHKWYLQVLTMDGWQDVRGTTGDDRLGYDDVAIEHRPGEGFEWTFEMTEEAIVAGHPHEDRLTVCPDLQAGRYRFVYDGIVSGEPLAVEFDYEGD